MPSLDRCSYAFVREMRKFFNQTMVAFMNLLAISTQHDTHRKAVSPRLGANREVGMALRLTRLATIFCTEFR
jgi:hypothetical protein